MYREHVAHINRITRRRRLTPHEKERLHSKGFSDWLNDYVRITRFFYDIVLYL